MVYLVMLAHTKKWFMACLFMYLPTIQRVCVILSLSILLQQKRQITATIGNMLFLYLGVVCLHLFHTELASVWNFSPKHWYGVPLGWWTREPEKSSHTAIKTKCKYVWLYIFLWNASISTLYLEKEVVAQMRFVNEKLLDIESGWLDGGRPKKNIKTCYLMFIF